MKRIRSTLATIATGLAALVGAQALSAQQVEQGPSCSVKAPSCSVEDTLIYKRGLVKPGAAFHADGKDTTYVGQAIIARSGAWQFQLDGASINPALINHGVTPQGLPNHGSLILYDADNQFVELRSEIRKLAGADAKNIITHTTVNGKTADVIDLALAYDVLGRDTNASKYARLLPVSMVGDNCGTRCGSNALWIPISPLSASRTDTITVEVPAATPAPETPTRSDAPTGTTTGGSVSDSPGTQPAAPRVRRAYLSFGPARIQEDNDKVVDPSAVPGNPAGLPEQKSGYHVVGYGGEVELGIPVSGKRGEILVRGSVSEVKGTRTNSLPKDNPYGLPNKVAVQSKNQDIQAMFNYRPLADHVGFQLAGAYHDGTGRSGMATGRAGLNFNLGKGFPTSITAGGQVTTIPSNAGGPTQTFKGFYGQVDVSNLLDGPGPFALGARAEFYRLTGSSGDDKTTLNGSYVEVIGRLAPVDHVAIEIGGSLRPGETYTRSVGGRHAETSKVDNLTAVVRAGIRF